VKHWEDEPYVRVYSRKDIDWKLLGWEGRTVHWHLRCEATGAGAIELGGLDPVAGVALLTDVPSAVVAIGLPRLLEAGTLVLEGQTLVFPDWLESQPVERGRRTWSKAHYASVFARDGQSCRYCGAASDLSIDHVRPRCRGGSDDPGNLVVACMSCNRRKGARLPEEAGMVLS
jgi:hypothetical protein